MTRPLDALAQGATPIVGRPLTALELANFGKYMNLLVKWQRSHRLVGSTDPMWIVEQLFLDSLLFLQLLPSPVRRLLDLGSGAGLPGLPIKIVWTDLEVTLVESRRRRVSFLSSAVRELGLDRTWVIESRGEDLPTELEGRFDAVVLRCAGSVEDLIPLAARLIASGGLVIASGPPRPKPLALGRWVEIPGLKPGKTRQFAVYQRP